MKVDAKIYNVTVITKKEQKGVKDVTQVYYRLGVWKDQEVGELRCTKEIYDQIEALHTYDLGFLFNTEYGSLQVDRVLQHYASSPFLDAFVAQQAAAVASASAEVPAAKEAASVPDQEQKEPEEKKEEAAATTKKK